MSGVAFDGVSTQSSCWCQSDPTAANRPTTNSSPATDFTSGFNKTLWDASPPVIWFEPITQKLKDQGVVPLTFNEVYDNVLGPYFWPGNKDSTAYRLGQGTTIAATVLPGAGLGATTRGIAATTSAKVLGSGLLKGSGPQSGVIEISARVKSVGAFNNFRPSSPRDFVFDPVTNRFAVQGKSVEKLGHTWLRWSIGASEDTVVGGTLTRGPGNKIITNEHSGHYGTNWTDSTRSRFVDFMNNYGFEVKHSQTW
jgi:hypothetical protein